MIKRMLIAAAVASVVGCAALSAHLPDPSLTLDACVKDPDVQALAAKAGVSPMAICAAVARAAGVLPKDQACDGGASGSCSAP